MSGRPHPPRPQTVRMLNPREHLAPDSRRGKGREGREGGERENTLFTHQEVSPHVPPDIPIPRAPNFLAGTAHFGDLFYTSVFLEMFWFLNINLSNF